MPLSASHNSAAAGRAKILQPGTEAPGTGASKIFRAPFRGDMNYSQYRAVVVSVSQIVTSFTRTRPLVLSFSREFVSS